MLALYRIYQLLVMLPLMAAVTIVAAVITATGSIAFGGRWWGYYPAKIWARIMCRLTLVSVEVRGRELIDPNTSYVFVANHQGAYDIFSVYGFLGHNFKWMMKRSLEKIPLVGWACKRAGHIYVDHTTHGIAATMKAAQRQLAGGMSLVVFPEGARTLTGTIDGAFAVMPRTSKIPRPGRIILTIHPAIDSADPDVMELSRKAIASALDAEKAIG